jgi:hypothetical protein
MKLARAFLALAILASATAAGAETISIGALKDNTIYDSTSALSNGAGEFIHTGITKEGVLRRGLIAFDIAGALPANAVITNVTLSMNMSQANDVTIVTPSALHRLLSNWGEGASNASGGEGGGAPAATGDATWQSAFHPDTPWTTAGGDFVPAASATIDVSGIGIYQWTSPEMVADAQDWLTDPSNNFGWLISTGNGVDLGTGKRFDSRTNPVAALQPALAIDYVVVPEPATAVLGAISLIAGGLVIRRRK